MSKVYMVKAICRWDRDTDGEIIGVASNTEQAKILVRTYIEKIYCYGSHTFDIYEFELDKFYDSGIVVIHYSKDDVLRIARELGKYNDVE